MIKNFYIFRHGQSSYNVEGRIQGHTNNSVLTETGIEQARRAGQLLMGKNIEIIISSPLNRAKQTGSIVSETIHTPIRFDDRFTEVNVGVVEGMHYTKVQEQYGELYKQWRSSDPRYADISFDKGETKRQVRTRVFAALNDYAANSSYTNIAISGHGITLSQTLTALGVEIPEIPNGAIIHLQNDNGTWKFVGFVN